MRKLAAVTILILAARAFAFQGRPVSDLRFEGRVPVTGHRVASDGTDFLLLVHRYEWFDDLTFVQKVVDGRPVGAQRYIAAGTPVGLAWTGDQYLAAWGSRTEGLRVGSLSRDGSPISMPETAVLQGDSFAIAADGTGALAFALANGKITVQPLDAAGRAIGNATTHAVAGAAGMKAAPVAGGFGVFFLGSTPGLMSFRADGTAITPNPVLVPASTGAAFATDGSDTLIVFGSRLQGGDAELKTALVGPDGVVKNTRVILTLPRSTHGDVYIAPVGLVWDGTRYVAAVQVDRDPGSQDSTNTDPALVPITRDGKLAGELTWVVEQEGWQTPFTLGWNGRELLMPMIAARPDYSYFFRIDPSSMKASPPVHLGRTLVTQWDLALQAGYGGYLAVWAEYSEGETTIRASRVDTAGNYLDGEGVILDATPESIQGRFDFENRNFAIDGNGPQWLVVWAHEGEIRGRTLSRDGVPGAATFAIGEGTDAAVQWDGAQYRVLRSDRSLYSTTVTTAGAVGESKLLGQYEVSTVGVVTEFTKYQNPVLTLLGGRMLAIYMKSYQQCFLGTPGNCLTEGTVVGRLLDDVDSPPFTIGTGIDGDIVISLSVAAAPTRALVLWSGWQEMRGAFLPAEAPQLAGASFHIDGWVGSAGYDGRDFVGAWWLENYPVDRKLITGKIAANGVVHDRRTLSFDRRPFWYTKPAVAAAANVPALVGFVDQLPVYDSIPRGALLFPGEMDIEVAAPPAPVIACATRIDDGTIQVRWQPVDDVLGFSIELELPDGTFRTVEVAPVDSVTATASVDRAEGSSVRVRAWNSGGFSAPSLIGPDLPAPQIDRQSRIVGAVRDQTTTLHVVTTAPGAHFAWYEGAPGDTTRRVGLDEPVFTTPAVTGTKQYWVRVTANCGRMDSDAMTVMVHGRRRAVR